MKIYCCLCGNKLADVYGWENLTCGELNISDAQFYCNIGDGCEKIIAKKQI